MFGKQSEKDTILFTGYRNCSTVCANTLPILQKLAKQNQNARLQVIFIELTGSEEKKKFLEPKFFPDIKWVKVKAEQEPILLSLLQLDRFERDHHSSRVVLHRGGSDIIQVVDHFSESKYNDWSQNSKKSLSLF